MVFAIGFEDKPIQASTPHDKISMTAYHWRNNDQGQNDDMPQKNGQSDENYLAQEKERITQGPCLAHCKDIEHDNEVQAESDLFWKCAASGMSKTLPNGNGYAHLKLLILCLMILQVTVYQAETIRVKSLILIPPYHGIPWTIPLTLYSKFRALYCWRAKDIKTPSRESNPPDPEKESELVDMKHSRKELSTDPIILERISKANGRGFTHTYLDNKIVIPIMLYLLWMLLIVIPMTILPCKEPSSDIRLKRFNCLSCIVTCCQRDIQKHFLLESVETKALCNGFPPALEEKNILSVIFESRDFIIAILIKYYEGQCLADKYTQNLCEHAVSDKGNCKRIHDRTTDIGGAEVFERTVNEHVGESRDSSHAGPSTEQDENFTFVTGNDNIFNIADRSTQYPSEEIRFESTNGPHISTEHREIENVQPNDSQNMNRSHDKLPTATENYSRIDSIKSMQKPSSLIYDRSARRDHLDLDKTQNNEEHSGNDAESHQQTNENLENVLTYQTDEELLNSASLDEDCCTGNDVCLNTSLTTSSKAMRRHHTDGCKKNATTSGNPKFFKRLRTKVRSESNLKIALKKVLSPNGNDIDVAEETRNYFTGNNQLPCFNHIRQLRQLREVTFIKQNVSKVRDRHLSSGIVLGVHNDRCESKAFNRTSLHETISDEREGSRAVGADGGSQLLTINSTSSETKAPLDVIAAIGVCSVTESMVYEWGRLKTFFNFPMKNPMMPVTLAKYGFYYTGDSDVVICFSCNVSHGNWQKGDSVYTVHYQKSRRCRFMNGEDKRNVPIHGDEAVSVDRRAGGRDISSRGSDGAEQNAILSTPGMVTSLFLELKPSKKTDTTGNIPKAAEGSGIKRGPPPATSASRASSRTAIQTTTSLQTVSPNSSATASPLTTTNPALTPKGAPNGHSSKMGSGDACNQQQSMNQQHPTTLDQRQQLRLEQTGGGQQPLQRQQDQTIVNGDARNSSNTGAATNFNNTEAAAARPRYPNYSSVTSRAGTFNGFPNHLDQTPLVMAKAGFFYAGYGDYVRCFVCGGGLRNWEPGDDPWVEHARWFPRCIHVKQHKGQSFINLVLQRQRELTLPNEYISIPGQTSSHGQSVTTQTASVQTHNDRQTGTTTSQKFAGKHTESKFETNNSTSTFGSPEKTDQELRQSFREDMNSPAVRGLIDMGYDDWTIQTAIQRLRQNQGSEELTEPALMEIISGFKKQTGSCNIQGPTAEAKEIQNVEFKTPRSQIARPGLRGGIAANSFTDEELKSIQEENAQLKEQMKCKICLDNDVCISFLPCGHLCCCAECAPVMVKCPICRQIIKGSVKTFLS